MPIGDVGSDLLSHLELRLEEIFSQPVATCQPLGYPAHAYDKGRRQYLSIPTLELLSGYRGSYDRALGVTDVDLYVPGREFIFGQADTVNQVAVISTVRLDRRFYHLPPDDELFLTRAVKEAVHEVGHTYGLKHCDRIECVMFLSNTIRDTDKKGEGFCPPCSKRLKLKSVRWL